jgi:hypothetical protein
LQKSLDASLLGATNVIANGCFGSGRVARLDRVDNRAVFQQGRLAALAASQQLLDAWSPKSDRKSTRTSRID